MARYLVRRLLLMIPVLILLTLSNFLLYSIAPGDPASAIVNEALISGALANMTAEEVEEMIQTQRELLGLDRPWYERYVIWLGSVMRGNLGESMVSSRTVAELIGARIWPTLQINLISLFITTVLGPVLGILQAIKKYSFFDYVAAFSSFFYVSMPGFFLAMLLVYIFGILLNWFPTGGYSTPGVETDFLDRVRHLALPTATLSLGGLPLMMRITRTAMLEVLSQDYIQTARAKGLREWVVTTRHALRNCLIPVVTVLGNRVMWLFSGSVIVETVFRWPGMGSLFIRVVAERDYPTIMGIVLLTSVLSVVVILVVDILYTIVDPRVRVER
jgi:peptide/nickel transport system permease protein